MVKIHHKITIIIFFFLINLHADIGGVVFQEFPVDNSTLNKYGEKDSNEIGVKGVKVTAYPSGKFTYTLADGKWTLDTNKSVRVEFSNWPTYLKESQTGSHHNSSIYFVQDGNQSINFGLYNVNDYTNNANPIYVTNLISNGSGIDNNISSIISVDYSATGLNKNFKDYDGTDGNGTTFKTDLNASITGTVWGKGFQSSYQRMFVSSVLWRHAGFATGNTGRIYVIDYHNTPANLIGSFDISGLGSVDRATDSDYILDKNVSAPSVDFDAYDKIGKISYGDLDFDNNTQLIWTVNLNKKEIISLDAHSSNIATIATTVKRYPILAAIGKPTCIGGELRPWGLGIHEGKGYIGIICDASISKNPGDLKAYVSEFNLTNPSVLKTVLSIDMDYDRKTLADGVQGLQTFQPWSDERHDGFVNLDYHNQPVLSDIDFDVKGNMYLAFLDRFALQVGNKNYAKKKGARFLLEQIQGFGEIFKVCNDNGNFFLEGTGTCPLGVSRNGDRDFFDDKGGDTNANPIGGALAILKGSNQILATSGDPHPKGQYGRTYWTTNGIQTFNTNSGEINNWYAALYSGNRKYTGKSVGLGDIELLTNEPPIELGNRIWEDNNKNGIQDANELGISNVKIDLVCSGNIVASVTTDSEGYYTFSNDTTGVTTLSQKYNINELTKNNKNNCHIVIPNVTGTNQQHVLTQYILTAENKGEGTNRILNDSNAQINGNNALIYVNPSDISDSGTNNHSFDVGFKPAKFALGNYLWLDTNHDGVQNSNESGIGGVTVNLYSNNDCSGTSIQTTVTTSNGLYLFDNLDRGNYCIEFIIGANNTVSPNTGTDNATNSDANASGFITNIHLTANDLDKDIGLFNVPHIPPNISTGNLRLGNYLWLDNNHDGHQDNNESGINGVTVNLYNSSDCSGTIFRTTVTANGGSPAHDGFYEFDNLSTGNYCIEFMIGTNNIVSPNTGTDNVTNSDANASGFITNIHLSTDDLNEDIGIFNASNVSTGNLRLGNYLWLDSNHDGHQDNNESGINGATVNLYNSTDCSGTIFRTTVTANGGSPAHDGFYEFDNLSTGNYCIEFMIGTNNIVSPNTGTDDTTNSDANASGFITNIHLTTDDLDEDIGVFNTIVGGASRDCSCSAYKESSVSIFSNMLTLLILILSTSLIAYRTFRKDVFI